MKAGRSQRQLERAEARARSLQEELNQTQQGLLALTMELDQRVEERTAELQAALAELSRTNSALASACEALRQSERQLRSLVEGVRDYAIYLLDPAGCVTSWNVGAERMKGYRAAEILGKHFSCFYLPADIAREEPAKHLQSAAAVGRHETEGWRVRKDGSRFWANVIITALHDDAGHLCGFAKVTGDVTERKQAQEKLQETAEELRRSNRDLEQFAFTVSHDLQEPLRAVNGFTRLLRRRFSGKMDAKGLEYIEGAAEGAVRMEHLILGLLAYSRAGTRGNPFTPTDLNKVLEEALHNLQASIKKAHASITSDVLPALAVDATQFIQLFQNLIGNALKFRDERPPEIQIRAREQEGRWVFSVRDNGIGIDPRSLERIFQIFQRLHTRQHYPGTGIGLAICRKIVERHGGAIWAESQPGQGSVFHFSIPQATAKTQFTE